MDPTSTQGKLCPHLLFFLLGAGITPGRGDGWPVLRDGAPAAVLARPRRAAFTLSAGVNPALFPAGPGAAAPAAHRAGDSSFQAAELFSLIISPLTC